MTDLSAKLLDINHTLSVVAVDLDDTIVRSDWTVSARTLRVLDEWHRRRGPVIIATGRPPRWTRRIPDALHVHPWICYNGAVAHNEAGEIIYRSLVPSDAARTIINQFQDRDPTCWLGLEIEDTLYINQADERPDATVVDDLLRFVDQPISKVLFQAEKAEELPEYLALLPEDVRALVSTKVALVQVMGRTTSKGAALAEMVKRWDLSLENVVSFGDDVNDVEMIEHCGLGVAMSNAVDEVKAVADMATASNDEDGVALVLEQLLAAGE